ncbi:GNAT family N-acetyltransferase [Phaeocystidibacter luteus]|uniref:N-acetyltransferase n=1 Tax=Phaeocystidibacter luteus TaxID=911197 RepID=A0A6N6RLR3_9FLAO|nr:GNAT family N-acetyltransferase [Phaeocystidibacter luteus]KAB2814501.1 N-acetyltransferase [Phaeocystidibacter luteus]
MDKFKISESLSEENRGQYEIVIDGSPKAYMKFTRLERVLILHHTEVLPFLRGKGAARQLLEHAVEDARSNNLTINAICPFSRKVLEQNEAYRDVYPND